MNLLLKLSPALTFALLLFGNNAIASEGADVALTIDGTTKISAEELIELLDEHDDLVIIDSRKPSDRAKGFIEDSIPLPDFDTSPTSLAEHLETKSTPVIFYCNGVKCGRSVRASKIAVKAGYQKIYWFRGGWGEWETKGYPVAK